MRLYILCLLVLLGVSLPVISQESGKDAQKLKKVRNVVTAISVVGEDEIAESAILNVITIDKGVKLDPFLIERDVRRVKSMGLFQDVRSEVVNFNGGKKLIFRVTENPLITDVIFKGNGDVSDSVLKRLIRSQPGELLNVNDLREDVQALNAFYKEKGFVLADIYKVDSPQRRDGPVIFSISEGYIDEILITGNTKTRDYVIFREMTFSTGNAVTQTELKEDLRRIFNLNYFESVNPEFLPGDEANQYKLQLEVTERPTGSLNIGGGFGQRSGLFLFSDLNVDNIFGTGQLVSVKGQWGENSNTYQLKYHNPWMWSGRRSFTARVWDTEGSIGFNSSTGESTSERRTGGSVSFGIPYSYDLRTSHSFKSEAIENPDINQVYYLRTYTFGVSYDTRDVWFNPWKGVYHSFSVEKGFKFEERSLDFEKYDLIFRTFTPTRKKQTIANRLAFGRLEGETEPGELYFLGGPYTVRGYLPFPDSFASGPSRAIWNLEYRFLLSRTFQFLVFMDVGWSSSLGPAFQDATVGKGFGLRLNTPLGPLRLDFGSGETEEIITHFSIGHIF